MSKWLEMEVAALKRQEQEKPEWTRPTAESNIWLPDHARNARRETVSQQRLKKQLLHLESVERFREPRVFREPESFQVKQWLALLSLLSLYYF